MPDPTATHDSPSPRLPAEALAEAAAVAGPDPSAQGYADLLRRERLLQSVFDNLRDGLVVFDLQRRIVFHNKRFLEITGLSQERLLDYRLGDIVHPDDRQRVREINQQLVSGKIEHATYTFRVVKNRQCHYIESAATPVRDSSGRIIGVEMLGREVTERERARQQLVEANRRLEEYKRANEEDLRMAWRVHRSLLAPRIRNRHIHLDVQFRPYHGVGGDYAHWHAPNDHQLYLTMCDCAGHGIAAALLATRVNSEVRQLVANGLPPSGVVQGLNKFIYASFADSGMFVSFLVGLFDFEAKTFTYCGAGHPGPLLLRPNCTETRVLASQHTLIGVQEDILIGELETTVPVSRGDRILLYTDGLTETVLWPDKPLGIDGLRRLACSHRKDDVFLMGRSMIEEIERMSAGPLSDDMTLLVAELQ